MTLLNPEQSEREFVKRITEWSTNHRSRRPRMRNGEQGTEEYILAEALSKIRNDPARHHSTEFSSLRMFDWWGSIITPKHKAMYETRCDMCKTPFYNSTKCNKRKNGYPVYRVCQHCHDWSIPKRMQMNATGKRSFPCAKVIISEPLPIKSGKSFSRRWTSRYRNPTKRTDIKQTEDDDAVQMVESGVTGLFHGAGTGTDNCRADGSR